MTEPTARYRNRTAEVEAVQWTGDNAEALSVFCTPFDFQTIDPEDRIEDPDQTAAVRESEHGTWRGLAPGDWVVKRGVDLFECSAGDFAKLYEPAAPAPATDQGELRDRIAEALIDWAYRSTDRKYAGLRRDETVRANAYSRADAVLAVLPAPAEEHRLALSEALGLGTGAPWDAIHDRATELGLPPLDRDPVAQRLGLVPAPADRAAGVADAIRTFPFDNFGMDDVSFALEDDPEAQEWVPALADAVLATLPATTAQAVELRDYWHREAMSATTRIIELEGQLAELRRMAAESAPADTGHDETPWGTCPGCGAAAGPDCDCPPLDEQAHAEGEHCFCGPECDGLDATARLERGRTQLVEAMSAVSEDRTCCGWTSEWARTLHAEGGIWETLGRAVGWPTGNYDQWVWVSWDEAAALYATPPAAAQQPKEA